MSKLQLYLLLLISIPAQAVEFNRVQTDKSTLTFAYQQMGVPLEGRFGRFGIKISFDPAKVDTSHSQIEVDLASIDTGYSEGNDEVGGKKWFNARIYPSAQFVSTGVRSLGDNRYEALGRLTIKGKTLEVLAPFTFKQEGAAGIFDGGFILKRLDYAIGEKPWDDVSAVANEVQVKFHVVATPARK